MTLSELMKHLNTVLKFVVLAAYLMLILPLASEAAEKTTRQQVKGLDEQVQEIKGEVLSIASELNQLEERLLYPSHTQMSFFVSLPEGEEFRLDHVELQIDGKQAAQHLYTYKELEALKLGGVQRLYTGNLKTGKHQLLVTASGKSASGDDFRHQQSFEVEKGVHPGMVELVLTHGLIALNNR